MVTTNAGTLELVDLDLLLEDSGETKCEVDWEDNCTREVQWILIPECGHSGLSCDHHKRYFLEYLAADIDHYLDCDECDNEIEHLDAVPV